jgi:hypothetical protein
VFSAVILAWSAGDGTGARAPSPPGHTLRNDRVGYTLSYPRGWKVAREVVSTAFAADASCESVRVVDFAPPTTVRSGKILQSFVQICAKRVRDGSSLDKFMRETYGRAMSSFEKTRLGGLPAYRTKDGSANTTFFLQTPKHRLQVVGAVVADSGKRARRLAQVQRILSSLSFRH